MVAVIHETDTATLKLSDFAFCSTLDTCLTVRRAPDMMHCLGRLQETSGGEVKDYMDVSCDDSQSEAYTRLKAYQLRVRLCVC